MVEVLAANRGRSVLQRRASIGELIKRREVDREYGEEFAYERRENSSVYKY